MGANADTWELVHALSSSEKRYFRRYATLRGSTEEFHYLKIFDLLHAQEKYDPEEIKSALADPQLIKRYSANKNYLSQLICKSMRAYNAEKFGLNRINGLLVDGIFLYNKTLYAQSQKKFQKARKLAEKSEHLTVLVEILRWERRLLKRLRTKDRSAQLLQNMEAARASIEQLSRETEYRNLYEKVYALIQANPSIRKLNVAELEQLSQHPLITEPKASDSFESQHFLFQIHIYQEQLKGNPEGAFHWQEKQFSLWQSRIDAQLEEPFRYSSVLNNLLSLATSTGRYDRYGEVRPLMDRVRLRSTYEIFQMRQQVYGLDLLHYLNCQDYAAGLQLVPEVAKWLDKSAERLNRSREVALRFNIALLYFLAGELSEGKKWFQNLLSLGRKPERIDIQAASHLFLLLSYYEGGHLELVESQGRTLTRFLKFYNPGGYWIECVPPLLRMLQLFSATQKDWRAFKAKLEAHQSYPQWNTQPGFNAFFQWLCIQAGD